MTEPWTFRNGTLDQAIFNGVVVLNEYRLPERFAPGDIVIDVGAHIGSFAEAVVSRGAGMSPASSPTERTSRSRRHT